MKSFSKCTLLIIALLMIATSSLFSQDRSNHNYYTLDLSKDIVNKYYNMPAFKCFIFVLERSGISKNYELGATAFDTHYNILGTFLINKTDKNEKISLPNVFDHGIYILTKDFMTSAGMDGSSTNDYDLKPISNDGKFVSYQVSSDKTSFFSFDLNPSPPAGITNFHANKLRKKVTFPAPKS